MTTVTTGRECLNGAEESEDENANHLLEELQVRREVMGCERGSSWQPGRFGSHVRGQGREEHQLS